MFFYDPSNKTKWKTLDKWINGIGSQNAYFTDNDYDKDIIHIWKTSCKNIKLTKHIKVLVLLSKQNFIRLYLIGIIFVSLFVLVWK